MFATVPRNLNPVRYVIVTDRGAQELPLIWSRIIPRCE